MSLESLTTLALSSRHSIANLPFTNHRSPALLPVPQLLPVFTSLLKKRNPKRLKYSTQRLYKVVIFLSYFSFLLFLVFRVSSFGWFFVFAGWSMKDDRLPMLYVEMDPLWVDTWKLEPVIKLIKDGAVGVIPTDTVFVLFSLIIWTNASFWLCSETCDCCWNGNSDMIEWSCLINPLFYW